MRNKPTTGNTLKFALFFGILFFFLLLISFVFKIGRIIATSTFDGSHQYNILVTDSLKNTSLFSFNPDTQSIIILSHYVSGLSVDGKIHTSSLNQSPKNIILSALFHKDASLTLLDEVRLFLFAQSIPSSGITTVDSIASNFTDHTLFQEGLSVAIVNAQGTLGLGNAVAKKLTTMGVNVISITTATNNQYVSQLFYAGKMSYTVKRLSEVVHIAKVQNMEQGISDITIVLGKDSNFLF